MTYLVFSTELDAHQLNALVFSRGLVASAFTPGTQTYADVRKHPYLNQWALPVDEKFTHLFTDAEIQSAQSLDESWADIEGQLRVEDVAALVIVDITPDPSDSTITRKAIVKELPINFVAKELQVQVSVQHYRSIGAGHNDSYIGNEKPNRQFILTTDRDVNEFEQLYGAISQGANMIGLMKQYLQLRASEGRFDV